LERRYDLSRIYFHTLGDEAEVLGSERGHLGCLIDDYTEARLHELQAAHPDRAYAILSESAVRQSSGRHIEPNWYCTRFTGPSSYGTSFLSWKGTGFSTFTTKLNTMTRSGNDDLILATRIYGMCEAHGWIDGADREWFAEKIEHALRTGTFRENHGWSDVIKLLRSTGKGEMVMSYSVTGGFPSSSFAWPEVDWNDWGAVEEAENDWEKLGSDGQWAAGMRRLRRDGTLRISPGRWGNVYAGANIAVQDLMCDDWSDRLDLAMSEEHGRIDPWR
jgi:hypothetical protein